MTTTNSPRQTITTAAALAGAAALAATAAGGDHRRVLWCEHQLNGADIRICRPDGTGLATVNPGLPWVNGLAIDAVNGRLYWTDDASNTINFGYMASPGSLALVSTGVESPHGIALDLERSRIYWADSILDQIKRCNYLGGAVTVFASIDGPQILDFNPANDSLYWTSQSAAPNTGKISRSSVVTPAVVDILTGLDGPLAIAVDPSFNGGTIFWSEAGATKRLRRASLNGTGITTILNTTSSTYEIDLEPDEGYIYFHDGQVKTIGYDGGGLQPVGPPYQSGHIPRGIAFYPGVRLFVKPTGSDGNDGLSWGTALREVRTAIARLGNGHPAEIWVQAGTYKPTSGTDRAISFVLRSDLEIYGGFAGTETSISQRNIAANPTILTGDLFGNDGPCGSFTCMAENSYHVVRADATVSSSAILDGFVVRGGNASGTGVDNSGGGMRIEGSPIIANCIIECNTALAAGGRGGGVYLTGSAKLTACTIRQNGAVNVESVGGHPRFVRCRINEAAEQRIGVVVDDGILDLLGCEVAANTGSSAIFVTGGATLAAYNCTIRSNDCSTAAIWGTSPADQVSLFNCALAMNYTDNDAFGEGSQVSAPSFGMSYCFLQGYTGSQFSIFGYGYAPNFVDRDGPDNQVCTVDDDLRLTATSPLVNAGYNLAVPADLTLDLNGLPRISGGTVDLGAFEFQGTPQPYAAPPPIAIAGSNAAMVVNNPENSVTLQRTRLDPTTVQWSLATPLAGGPVQIVFPLSQYPDPMDVPAVQCNDLYTFDVSQVPGDPYVDGGEVELAYELAGSVSGMERGQRLIFGWDLGDDDVPSLLGGPYDEAEGESASFEFAIAGQGSVHHLPCPTLPSGIGSACEYGTYDGTADGNATMSDGDLEFEQGFEFGSAFQQYGISYGWFIAVVDYAPGSTNTVTVNLDLMRVTFNIVNATLGDLNNDGIVSVPDLLALLAAWGPCAPPGGGSCPADLNLDGSVGVGDLLLLLANWG
jgi:hypothetical protein